MHSIEEGDKPRSSNTLLVREPLFSPRKYGFLYINKIVIIGLLALLAMVLNQHG
jgi:hypothetical protein